MSYPLPTFKRFQTEDYKDAQPWFSRFIQSLNLYTEPIYNILDGNISPFSNANEETYLLKITAGAAAADNTALFAPKRFKGVPSGVVVAQCLPVAAVPTAVGAQVTLDWFWNGTQIQILAIYGLTVGEVYNINVRIF